jgi:hypothetical protein
MPPLRKTDRDFARLQPAFSSGAVPESFAGMAKNAEAFINALGLNNWIFSGFPLAEWSRK